VDAGKAELARAKKRHIMKKPLTRPQKLPTGPSTSDYRLTASAVILAVLITVLWGANPTALKIAVGEMPSLSEQGFPPIGAAGVRFAIAAACVWVWCLLTGIRVRPRPGEWPWLLAITAFFVAQIATFSLGVYWGTASHSIVILHTYPFFVMMLAHFFLVGDRATPGRVAGLVLAFTGIAVLFAGDWGRWQGLQALGDTVQLASAIILAAQIVFTKRAMERVSPDRVVLWEMALGAPLFLLYSFAKEGLAATQPGVWSIIAVLFQGIIIGAFCFLIWTWLIRRHSASRVAIFGFIAPLIGVFLSTFLLREPVSPTLVLSASLVAAGIVLANVR
jgi:drug/metabolite transporter (DMT)-like permease